MEQKTKVYIAIGTVVIIAIAIYVFSGNKSGTSSGFAGVKNAYNNAANQQRELSGQLQGIDAGVGDSQTTLNGIREASGNIRSENSKIRSSIDSVENTNRSSEELINQNRDILERCQFIIGDIQQGGTKETSTSK